MLLKAGTYRFNDVIDFSTIPVNNDGDGFYLPYTVHIYMPSYGLDSFAYCDHIGVRNAVYDSVTYKEVTFNAYDIVPEIDGITLPYAFFVYTDEDGWKISSYGEYIQSVTILQDVEVSNLHYEWFISNTNYNEVNPSLKIGETRLFTKEITGVNESETVIHDSFRFTLGNGVQQYGMQMANGRLYYDGTVDSFYQVAAGYILHDYATFIDDKYRTIILQELPTDPDIIALILNNSSVVEDDSTRYLIKKTTLTGIANAIRSKSGKTDLIPTEDMASEIEALNVTNQ